MSINKVEESRYIEIKKMAYGYYAQYNSLDRPSRKHFLLALPELENSYATAILRNTLLFPDTEELLSVSNGHLYGVLKKISENEDNIQPGDAFAKSVEYANQRTRQLIQNGTLQVMEGLKYPDNSISEKEYLSLKKEAVDVFKDFVELDLNKKVRFICSCCQEVNYQAQIQLATLLIPNDKMLMAQLQTNSIEELAQYYRVPESMINFKKIEYDRQDTIELIKEKKLSENKNTLPWYKNLIDDTLILEMWDQGFYKSIENDHIDRANKHLSKMYQSFSKTNIK